MSFESRLDEILDANENNRFQRAVEAIAQEFEAMTCTLHANEEGLLKMRASIGLPPPVEAIAQTIPIGKGMAGICAERREPVTVCNLQTDSSGVVRPGAKETAVAGALVVPILRGEVVLGTLGIGKSQDHDYEEEEIGRLTRIGEKLAERF